MSTTIDQLETPEVLVDRERLAANIERVQAIATRHQLALRPHAKTHKCIEVARLQREHGATGLTASKADEAIVFIESGVTRSITVAYPIVDARKLARLMAAAEAHNVALRLVVDSATGIEVAQQSRATVGVFLKIDVGLHRCGIGDTTTDLVDLAARICESGNLDFRGVLSHAGHAYAAGAADGIRRVANDERDVLLRARDRLSAAKIPVSEISVGSTPTVLASEGFGDITEIRPGNYVFLDATAVRLGIATVGQVALTVLATIISRNDSYFIIDAGSKVLSSDLGAHGTAAPGYGLAFTRNDELPLKIARLSEEHGFVERGSLDLPIGTRLRVVPNHACPVANLAERLTIVSGEEVIDQWAVAARAKVR